MTASSKYVPEHWETMREALQTWLEDESGLTVVIQRQDAPSPARPFVSWGLLVPPVQDGRLEERNLGPCIQVSRIETADYTVTVDGFVCSYSAVEDDTAHEIRTALIAQIETLTEYTVISVGSDALTIVGDPTIEDLSDNLSLKIAQQSLGEALTTITVEVLATELDSAALMCSQLQQSLETEPVVESLNVAGLAIASIENVRNLSEPFAGKWEDRAGFDVRLRVRTRNIKLIDVLESIGNVTGDLHT